MGVALNGRCATSHLLRFNDIDLLVLNLSKLSPKAHVDDSIGKARKVSRGAFSCYYHNQLTYLKQQLWATLPSLADRIKMSHDVEDPLGCMMVPLFEL